jgi:hypothetical protein
MGRWKYLIGVIVVTTVSGCSHIRFGPTSSGMVLLSISDDEITRLGSRLGLTNAFCLSPGRDAKGECLLLTFWSSLGRTNKCLVTVTEEGVHAGPWVNSNEEIMQGAGRFSLQAPPEWGWDARWSPALPSDCNVASVSADWAAFTGHNRLPWLARIETPNVAALELQDSPSRISIWTQGEVVHLFTRPGWRYEEGPLKYRVYDFEYGTPRLVKELDLPRARRVEDMDPQAGLVVLQSNNRSLARTSLLDLKTGKTKFLRVWPSMVAFVFVKKETAQEWIKLTQP